MNDFFDVCIVCALAEEVTSLLKAFKKFENVNFIQSFAKNRRAYKRAEFYNNNGEKLNIHVSWPPKFGSVDMSLHLKSILDEFQPTFIAMSGICAGDKKEVKLGDIIVGERAFQYDSGKVIESPDGTKQHEPDTDTEHPDKNTLQYLKQFESWKTNVHTIERPISKRQQRDWILSTLELSSTKLFDDIPDTDLKINAPDWREILHELQTGENPFLKERILKDVSRVKDLSYSREIFPYVDKKRPDCFIAPIASGSAVRSDSPFDEFCFPVRKTVAIDMESYPFYRAVSDYPGIRSLLVKGVCDYADMEKDDSFHEYSSIVSSIYIISFIKEYVNYQLMPRVLFETFKHDNNKIRCRHCLIKNTLEKKNNSVISIERDLNNFDHHQSWLFEPSSIEKDLVEELKNIMLEAYNSNQRKRTKSLLEKAKILCVKLRKNDFYAYAKFYPEILSNLALETEKPIAKNNYWKELVKFITSSSEKLSDIKYDIYVSNKVVDYIQDQHTQLMYKEATKLIAFCKNRIDSHLDSAEDYDKSKLLSIKSKLIRYSGKYATNKVQKIKIADAAIRCSQLSIEVIPDNWNSYMENGLSLWYRSQFDKSDFVYNNRLKSCEENLWESVCLKPNIYNLLTICYFYKRTYQTLPYLDCFIYYQEKEYNKRRLLRASDGYGEAVLQLWYSEYPENFVYNYIEDAEYLLENAINSECADARHIISLAFIKAIKGEVDIGNRTLTKLHGLSVGSSWSDIANIIQNINSEDELVDKGFSLGINQSSIWNKLGTYAYDFLNDIDMSIFLYKEALRLNKNNAVAMTNLARALLSKSHDNIDEAQYWISGAASNSNRRFQWWKIIKEQIDEIKTTSLKPFDLKKLSVINYRVSNIKDIKRIYNTLKYQYVNINLEEEFNRIINNLFKVALSNNSKATIFHRELNESHSFDIEYGFTFFDSEIYSIKTSCSQNPVSSSEMEAFIKEISKKGGKGIIVSMSGYSEQAIEILRKSLQQAQIILIDRDDLEGILKNSPPLDEAIRIKQLFLASESNPYYNIKKGKIPSSSGRLQMTFSGSLFFAP